MKILSFGAGMQSTALALMSCENAKAKSNVPYPLVPVYDAVIYCDLGLEPPWVYHQLEFTRKACEDAGIFFKVLDTPLYQDFLKNFGERRTISIGTPGSELADSFAIQSLLPNRLKDQFCFRTEAAIKSLEYVRSDRYGDIKK